MDDKLIMVFHWKNKKLEFDIEVPAFLTANELVLALNDGLNLGIDVKDITQVYLKATNPIALLKGPRTLESYGFHQGTDLWFDR